MADKDGNTKAKGGAKAPRGKKTPESWVENQLRQLYDDVAAEPLPQDLLDLLDKIDLDGPAGDKGGEGR